jgi:hypothetical protein
VLDEGLLNFLQIKPYPKTTVRRFKRPKMLRFIQKTLVSKKRVKPLFAGLAVRALYAAGRFIIKRPFRGLSSLGKLSKIPPQTQLPFRYSKKKRSIRRSFRSMMSKIINKYLDFTRLLLSLFFINFLKKAKAKGFTLPDSTKLRPIPQPSIRYIRKMSRITLLRFNNLGGGVFSKVLKTRRRSSNKNTLLYS